MKRISLIVSLLAVLASASFAQDHAGVVRTDQVFWQFGQRTYLYTILPGEMTAFQINPNPIHPPAIGTQAELTLYRINEPGATGRREFFNILTATGFGYDRGLQNDHQVRFGMETAFGGKHIPIFFCFEAPQGQAADCPLRIYGGDNANRGVWLCRQEGDCKDLLKALWEPQVIGVVQVEPVHTLR